MTLTALPVDHPHGGRGLSTARSVLRALRLLSEHPEGVRADRVAVEVGKSVSTAYQLLASLCDEGFAERVEGGLYRFTEPAPVRTPKAVAEDRLSGAVEELFARTRRRCYLGVIAG